MRELWLSKMADVERGETNAVASKGYLLVNSNKVTIRTAAVRQKFVAKSTAP